MTTNKFEISDIFSIFHDGAISKFSDEKTYSILHIDCIYLAERQDKDFMYFVLKVYGLRELSLKVWPREKGKHSYIMTNPMLIFQTKLDIFNSELINNKIEVRIGQENNKALDYAGGDLSFDWHQNFYPGLERN